MAPKKSKSKSKKKNKDEDSLVKASPATADGAGKDGKEEEEPDMTHAYAENLRAEIYTDVNANPKALVHTTEWRKIMNGARAFKSSFCAVDAFAIDALYRLTNLTDLTRTRLVGRDRRPRGN